MMGNEGKQRRCIEMNADEKRWVKWVQMRPIIGVCWPMNALNICFNFNVVFHFGESWWVYP